MKCGSEFASGVSFCPSCGTPTTLSTPPVKASDMTSEIDVAQQVKAPKKLSAKLLAVLIIVFIVGATLGGAATRSGTTTVTKTIQMQSTVTQALDVSKYTAAMKSILSEAADISFKTADNMRATVNHQMSQADLLAFIRDQKNNLGRLMENALRLQPPPAFSEAHLHIVKSLGLEYSAFTLYEEGLTQNNASLINEGNAFTNQADNEMKTATSILNSTT